MFNLTLSHSLFALVLFSFLVVIFFPNVSKIVLSDYLRKESQGFKGIASQERVSKVLYIALSILTAFTIFPLVFTQIRSNTFNFSEVMYLVLALSVLHDILFIFTLIKWNQDVKNLLWIRNFLIPFHCIIAIFSVVILLFFV